MSRKYHSRYIRSVAVLGGMVALFGNIPPAGASFFLRVGIIFALAYVIEPAVTRLFCPGKEPD